MRKEGKSRARLWIAGVVGAVVVAGAVVLNAYRYVVAGGDETILPVRIARKLGVKPTVPPYRRR